MNSVPPSSPLESPFEELIDGLLNQGFGLSDQLFTPSLLTGLRENLMRYHQAGEMYSAGVGRKFDYQHNAEVRGDVIRWIEADSEDPHEQAFHLRIADFVHYLNRTCYTSINAYEFHYACYEPGSFFKRHLDQFRRDRGRKFSFVMYLNEDWQPQDGGQLVLYLEPGAEEVLPLGGRTIFFKSDEVEHEVKPAPERVRIGIAGWLKSW